jgi:hypothetical protein
MDYTLQNKINRRMNQLKRDGVKFISGTIAPADSCEATPSIEPVFKAIDYFESKNPQMTLSAQLKWMGSRGTMYLFRGNLEASFVVTRSGFKIGYGSDRLENSKDFFKHWYNKIFKDKAFDDAVEVILDGEMMPWNAIGEGLIQRQFVGYSNAVHTEIDFLIEHGFDLVVQDAMNDARVQYLGLDAADRKKHPRRETFDLTKDILYNYDSETQADCIEKFDVQLRNFNSPDKPYYVAFDILRVKYSNGTVMVDEGWMASNVVKYSMLRKMWPKTAKDMVHGLMECIAAEAPLVCQDNISFKDIFDIGLPIEGSDTQEFLENLMSIVERFGFEGIMIKPEFPMDTDAVHAMKVRNPEYLRLIYGHDYTVESNLMPLIEKKRTGKKRKLSHNEYRLGIQMLKLDESSATYEEDFERIAKKILFDIEEESTVDSRL